eukprot:GHVP01023166.1.p1 GENE.GHVP01023166.1~~GHVP01023166.1.p1  ORF type:complete len:588 (-),score=88.25 GHVP01023166.1:1349-3085(-)
MSDLVLTMPSGLKTQECEQFPGFIEETSKTRSRFLQDSNNLIEYNGNVFIEDTNGKHLSEYSGEEKINKIQHDVTDTKDAVWPSNQKSTGLEGLNNFLATNNQRRGNDFLLEDRNHLRKNVFRHDFEEYFVSKLPTKTSSENKIGILFFLFSILFFLDFFFFSFFLKGETVAETVKQRVQDSRFKSKEFDTADWRTLKSIRSLEELKQWFEVIPDLFVSNENIPETSVLYLNQIVGPIRFTLRRISVEFLKSVPGVLWKSLKIDPESRFGEFTEENENYSTSENQFQYSRNSGYKNLGGYVEWVTSKNKEIAANQILSLLSSGYIDKQLSVFIMEFMTENSVYGVLSCSRVVLSFDAYGLVSQKVKVSSVVGNMPLVGCLCFLAVYSAVTIFATIILFRELKYQGARSWNFFHVLETSVCVTGFVLIILCLTKIFLIDVQSFQDLTEDSFKGPPFLEYFLCLVRKNFRSIAGTVGSLHIVCKGNNLKVPWFENFLSVLPSIGGFFPLRLWVRNHSPFESVILTMICLAAIHFLAYNSIFSLFILQGSEALEEKKEKYQEFLCNSKWHYIRSKIKKKCK